VTTAEGLEGVVLRYGPFYGPGTAVAPGGSIVEDVRKRRFPVVGDGGGVWSFVHIDDVASATVAALERGAPGIYNVVDDEPATVAEWLPALAEAIGARPPRRVPAFVARAASGAHGVAMMTEIRGAKNAKAKRELGWQPYHPTWREGFRTALG
jgi:nucleoside-diphosphate-sugar epimerase